MADPAPQQQQQRGRLRCVFFLFLSIATSSSYGFSDCRYRSHATPTPTRTASASATTTPLLANSPRITTTAPEGFEFDDTKRAGTGGYSVMRQPASRSAWDPQADPEFELPTNLDEEKESSGQQVNDDWWSSKVSSSSTTTSTTTSPSPSQSSKPSSPSSSDAWAKKETAAKKRQGQPADAIRGPDSEQLDLFQRTLDTLDYPRVMQSLYSECTTAPARTTVQQATTILMGKTKPSQQKIPAGYEKAHQPLTADSVQGVQDRYRAVQEMEWLLNNGHADVDLNRYTYKNRKGYKEDLAGRPAPLGGNAFNLELILTAADQGRVLEGEEILDISAMLDHMGNVLLWSSGLQKVEELEFLELPRIAECITVNHTLQELLRNAFDKDGKLSGSTFPVVGRFRARVRALKGDIMGMLDNLLTMPSIKSKLATEGGGALISEVSGGRLVLPVDAKHASSIGIVHDSSRSGKTVYVEPTEIVGPTNELRQAEGELRQEEARVWRSLTEQILINRIPLETSVKAIGQLDLVFARVLLGRKLMGTIPVVQDEGVISLRNAKHPVLLLREIANVVGSDVDLGNNGNQGLVLTGPNAGGKTVILKLLGLIALMSRGGIPIPADRGSTVRGDSEEAYQPRVDFFNPVLADIGDLQSVGGDLSTFSGHMLVCREVLANSGKNALVLMDEVGSGTDPAQGVAIAQALLEALMDSGARVAITTHYMQLKQLAAADDRFAVGGMQFVGGRPTYKLLPGTVGESFALAVAERLKLPQKVLDRATELLDSETRQMGDLLRELEDQKELVDQQAKALEEKRKEMVKLEIEMKEQQIKLEKKQLNARRDEARKFAQKLEEKEQVLEDVLEKLKSDPSRRLVAKSWEDIRFVKRDGKSSRSLCCRPRPDLAALAVLIILTHRSLLLLRYSH